MYLSFYVYFSEATLSFTPISLYSVCARMRACVCVHFLHSSSWTLVYIFSFFLLLITFSISMYIMCVITYTMLVQHFEPQGMCLTNLHYYYYYHFCGILVLVIYFLCASLCVCVCVCVHAWVHAFVCDLLFVIPAERLTFCLQCLEYKVKRTKRSFLAREGGNVFLSAQLVDFGWFNLLICFLESYCKALELGHFGTISK